MPSDTNPDDYGQNLTSGYRGRFAPSPTGPLHFGSLLAAVASYLQARSQSGAWLLRIDDIDPPREISGAADDIIATLDSHGFEWDEPILWQSRRLDYYRSRTNSLLADDLAFRCTCSRQDVRASGNHGRSGPIYPGNCRNKQLTSIDAPAAAIRARAGGGHVRFEDAARGAQERLAQRDYGDFIVQRRDGLPAYNMASVADDAAQGITEVVRGVDLLESTAIQIRLQQMLNYPTPAYMHLPLALNSAGQKLSKQNSALSVSTLDRSYNILNCLSFLEQNPPAELKGAGLAKVWDWGIQNWDRTALIALGDQEAPAEYL